MVTQGYVWHERRPLTFCLRGISLAIPMHTILISLGTHNQYIINLHLY